MEAEALAELMLADLSTVCHQLARSPAWPLSLCSLNAGMAGRPPCRPSFDMGPVDLNCGPAAFEARALSTEQTSQP